MTDRWEFATFGDLYLEPSRNGFTAPKAERGFGVPMVNMRELFRFDVISDQSSELVPIASGVLDKWTLKDLDLLFGRRSLTLAGAGKCSIVARTSKPTVFESSIIRVRLDRAKADPRFYFYLFRSSNGRAIMETIVEQVAVAGIRSSDLARLCVPLPPLEEQRRIAEVLGALDDLIDNSRKLSQAIDDWQTAEFRRRWDRESRVPLSSVAQVTMGQSPPGSSYNEVGSGIAFYQGTRDFGWRFPTNRVWTTAPTRIAAAGDVLVAVRAPVGDLNIATEKTSLGRGVAGLSADGRQATLFQALRADANLWDVYQGTGTVFASINKKDMGSLEVPWVDDEYLERGLAAADEAIRELHYETDELTQTRDELLPLLVSGRVRVRDLAGVV